MNESSQDMPIREIYFIDQEDNQTLPSELSTLLTKKYGGYDNVGAQGCSHPVSMPPHPTWQSGRTEISHVTKRAFQLALTLGVMSLSILLYADVVVNINNAVQYSAARWDIRNDSLDVGGGGRFKQEIETTAHDEEHKKASFWHKLRNHETKSAKKTRTAKTAKNDGSASDVKDTNEVDDSNESQDEERDTDSDSNAMTDDDNTDDQLVSINPKKHNKPKLIPSDVIASATSITNNTKYSKDYKPMDIPVATKRCPYVIQTFADQNGGVSQDFLKEKYIAQSVDPNVFYRATALIFWKDFGSQHAQRWGEDQSKSINLEELVLLDEATYEDGTPLSPLSTWTWITGDQHLSNFGAWRNRGGEVVFSVNDFDEAAIYDFHIDVLRISVSICKL